MADAPNFIPLTNSPPPSSPAPNFIDLSQTTSPQQQSTKPSGFVSRTVDSLKEAGRQFQKDPTAFEEGAETALVKGAMDMVNLSLSGVGAIVKGMFTYTPVDPKLSPQDQAKQSFDNTIKQFVDNKDKIQAALTHINNAPPDQQEAAVSNLLGIIPDGIHAAGDTVFEKTGNALAGAGTEALLTLLSLSPEIASKVMKPVSITDALRGGTDKGISHRGEMTPEEERAANISGRPVSAEETRTTKQAQSKIAASFDQLAATKGGAASAIAQHVGQVDKNTEKYLKSRIQKFVDASDKELSKIGVAAAKANIKDLEGDYATIKGKALGGQKAKPGEVLAAEAPISAEKASASIRTTVKEAQETFAQLQTAEVKQFPQQTVPGSAKDFVNEVEKGTGTSRMKDQLNDPSKLKAYLDDNAGVPEAWSLDYMRENWKTKVEHTPGYSYAWQVTSPFEKAKSFKSEIEARRYAKRTQDSVDKEVEHQADVRKKKGIPDHQSVTEFNLEKDFPEKYGKKPDDEPPKPPKGSGPNVVYLNSGIPVTRAAVEKSFDMAHQALLAVPGVKISEAKLGTLLDKYIRTFNPEALGPEAKIAASEIAKGYFQQAAKEHQVWEQSKGRRQYWLQMGKDAGMQFIDKFETGGKMPNPIWDKARTAYKNWSQDIFEQDMRTGFKYEAVDHYMPHLFKDEEGVRGWLTKKYGNKWADPGFIKDRSFDLYKEAIAANFTPKFTNPEEIMMARQRASDVAAMRTDLLTNLERDGVAVKAGKGETRPPAGYSANSRRSPTGQRYWVNEIADAVMKNAFDSKSLWENQNLAGDAFRGWMGLKNTIVPIKLAMSAFHPLHVMHIDTAAHVTRATKELVAGQGNVVVRAGKFITELPKIMTNLVNNPRTGSPMLRVFQGKRSFDSLSDAQKKGYQYLTESGMIPTRPREEMTNSIQLFNDALAAGSAKALWHVPGAMMKALGEPIYGHWIPSLKIASLMKDAETAMRLNPELASNSLQRGIMLRNIAKKVESRYGEINYNSWFMNKMAKDIGVAGTLSFGWNVGLIDQYVGGAMDLAHGVKEVGLDLLDPNAKGSKIKKLVKAGDLDRPIQAMLYVSSALTIGGLMHYAFTGKPPETIADYTHPKSGEKDQYGRDIRLNTMFYTREFEGLYKHMEAEGAVEGLKDFVVNKGSGLYEMMSTALKGVDSLGREVRDPDGPVYRKVAQTLAYEFADLEPISIEAMGKAKDGNKAKDIALSVAGFTPAGKYISQTKIENKIGIDYDKYVRAKETPYDQVVKSKDFKDLQEAYTKDDPSYDRKLDTAQDKFDLKSADIRRLEKQFRHDDQFDINKYQFSRLPWQQQRGLLDQMSKAEREVYLPISNKKHLRGNYDEPAAE